MEVKNLNELFAEFKKYQKTKKNVANEDNFYDYVGIYCSLKSENSKATDLVGGAWIELKDYSELVLDFNFSKLNIKSYAWGEKYEQNMEKVLKDIWTTGKIKDTYGLNLDWPNKQSKTIENPAPEPKDKTKESINEQPNQENNKIWWIIGSLILVSSVGLIAWLIFRKKAKNKE